MRSRWYESKEKAVTLRKKGQSIKEIEKRLGIPRSTLSGWFKNIKLSKAQQAKLLQNKKKGLIAARKKAAAWHRAQKERRIAIARQKASETLAKIDVENPDIVELALAILYLGEGAKKTSGTALGSSDPAIVRLFIASLRKVYGLEKTKMRAELHLRADQDSNRSKKYWAKELEMPLENFSYVSKDKRTRGSKTFSSYHGVCHIRCGNVNIQRRLLFLSKMYCTKVSEYNLGS